MENRPLPVVAGLIAGLFLAGAACAAGPEAGPTPEQQADWAHRLEAAKAQQERAAAMKSAAAEALEARKVACFEKFRVSACQAEAKQDYIKATAEARRLDNEGKALERLVKKEQLADKDARRLEAAPQREADLRARETATAAEREGSDAARARKLEKKEERVREGEARTAANEERIRQKQEKHERQVAEKMERARQREAGAGR